MTKVMIQLKLAEQVKDFVNCVNRYDMPMDLRSGRHFVDAKSILGIFSLDLSRDMELLIHDSDTTSAQTKLLLTDISRFTAAAH